MRTLLGASKQQAPKVTKPKKAKKDTAALPVDVLADNDILYTVEITANQSK